MRMLDRYIASSIIKATLTTLTVLTILLLLLEFVDAMGDVGQGDFNMMDAFIVALLWAPRFIYESFPVAALIGSLLGLGMLANNSELIAMRAAGYSLRHIVLAVVKAGLAMIVVVFLLGELIAPPSIQYGERLRNEKQHRHVTLMTRHGFWAKDGDAFINIRKILPGGRLEDIYFYELNNQRKLVLASHAKVGEYRDGNWVLHDIRQSRISDQGVETRELEHANWNSLLSPELLNIVVVKPIMLPVWELYQYIQYMEENRQSTTTYAVAFWTKVSTPVSTLVMLIMAIPFVLGSMRSVSIGQRIIVGIMLGTGFFLLTRAFSYMAVVYDIAPFLASALPSMVFLGLSVWMLRRVR